jgi:DNA-binding CsgD family transcriptional regulator
VGAAATSSAAVAVVAVGPVVGIRVVLLRVEKTPACPLWDVLKRPQLGGLKTPQMRGLRTAAVLPPSVWVSTTARSATHHRQELIAGAASADNVADLFAAASDHLRRLVPFDAATWLATDPSTNLPTAPTRTENLAPVADTDDCMRHLELELLVDDINLYRDLARADTPAAGLRMATRDRPTRSARYRALLAPKGIDDELRAVIRVDGRPWAWCVLYRQRGRPAFNPLEIDLAASLSTPLAQAVRDHARHPTRSSVPPDGPAPGLMLFAPDGQLISINDDALAWLDEITWLDDAPTGFNGEATFGASLPTAVTSTLMQARAATQQRDGRSARTRIRSNAGRWLVCHASCLRDADGAIGNTALVIEPAKASEIAPIVVQAYDLSAREQQITQLISHGAATTEIANRLHLSTHTVRDYIKVIFDKVGVSSRGELVATLYAEHYAPIHQDANNVERVN